MSNRMRGRGGYRGDHTIDFFTLIVMAIIVASELIVAALLDHFGWLGAAVRPIALSRFAGIGVLILGVWLMTR